MPLNAIFYGAPHYSLLSTNYSLKKAATIPCSGPIRARSPPTSAAVTLDTASTATGPYVHSAKTYRKDSLFLLYKKVLAVVFSTIY